MRENTESGYRTRTTEKRTERADNVTERGERRQRGESRRDEQKGRIWDEGDGNYREESGGSYRKENREG